MPLILLTTTPVSECGSERRDEVLGDDAEVSFGRRALAGQAGKS